MEKLDSFTIDLMDRNVCAVTLCYNLKDDFFQRMEGDILGGTVECRVTVSGGPALFRLGIACEGEVKIPCDRCLAEMTSEVSSYDELSVKLGDTYSDEGDVVTVPEEEGVLDIEHILYEYISLSLPIKHVHEPGMCDDAMMEVLSQHQAARSSFEEDDESIDRCEDSEGVVPDAGNCNSDWKDKLKKIIDNN